MKTKFRFNAIAIDCESSGINVANGSESFLWTACDLEGNTFHWEFEIDPVTGRVIRDWSKIQKMIRLLNKYHTWIFHNGNFDLRMLAVLLKMPYEEIHTIRGLSKDEFWERIEDTIVMSHLIDNIRSHGLKELAERFVKIPKDDEEELKSAVIKARTAARSIIRKNKLEDWMIHGPTEENYWLPKYIFDNYRSYAKPEWETVCLTYAIRDVERTIILYQFFMDLLKQRKLWEVYREQIQVMRTIVNLEGRGMNFFADRATEGISTIESSMKELDSILLTIAKQHKVPEINFDSPKQIANLLYEKMGVPILPGTLTESGNPSVSKDVLDLLLRVKKVPSIAKSFIRGYQERQIESTSLKFIKNYQSFKVKVPVGKRFRYALYPNINQIGTKTTRVSSYNPNGQNISTGVEEEDDHGVKHKRFNLRELFGPPPGFVWFSIDYTSLQLILFAYEANDTGMIESFSKGYDFHNYVACGLFNTDKPTKEQRKIAKNVNYALIFGGGATTVDLTAGMNGAYELYCTQFPIVAEYMEQVMSQVRRKGYVETAFGYPLMVPRDEPYKGVNYKIQGDEGIIVKRAMVSTEKYLDGHRSQGKLIMQIHDELLFECPAERKGLFPLKKIVQLMMKPAKDIGWVTPVSPALITKDWSIEEKLTVAV